ncbi:MAG: hypothetical protein HYY46_11895 [Deltaproteobacteria bacterium]|nr:hypothetical protein [Deltaproteobacteria bacterium]
MKSVKAAVVEPRLWIEPEDLAIDEAVAYATLCKRMGVELKVERQR